MSGCFFGCMIMIMILVVCRINETCNSNDRICFGYMIINVGYFKVLCFRYELRMNDVIIVIFDG
jgi:hypothetical protein